MIGRGAYVAGVPRSPVAHLYTGTVPEGGGRLPGRSMCGARTTSLRRLPDESVTHGGGRRPCRRCGVVWFASSTRPTRAGFVAAYDRHTRRDLWLAAWWAQTPAEVDRMITAALLTHAPTLKTQDGPGGASLYDHLTQRRAVTAYACLSPDERADVDARRDADALHLRELLAASNRADKRERRARWDHRRRSVWADFNLPA